MQPDPIRDALYALPDPCTDVVCDPGKAPRQSHARNRLWLLNTATLSALALAATNADSVERWAAAQPPNWGTETVRLTAGVFAERMALIGADQPRRQIRASWEDWKAADWEDIEAK